MNRIHIEIAGRDGARLQRFYSELLQWKITQEDAGGYSYGRVADGEQPSVGFRHEPDGKAEIVVYVEVDSVESALERAKTLGAKVRIPRKESGDLCFALLEDPEGNPIGITEKKQG